MLYPEGTRSQNGEMARFHHGVSLLATQAGVPVVPIYMEGLRNVMPKGQRTPQPAEVSARIGAPVSLDGVGSISEATEMLENAMRELAGQPPHHAVAQAAEAEMAMAQSSAGGGAGGGGS